MLYNAIELAYNSHLNETIILPKRKCGFNFYVFVQVKQ